MTEPQHVFVVIHERIGFKRTARTYTLEYILMRVFIILSGDNIALEKVLLEIGQAGLKESKLISAISLKFIF